MHNTRTRDVIPRFGLYIRFVVIGSASCFHSFRAMYSAASALGYSSPALMLSKSMISTSYPWGTCVFADLGHPARYRDENLTLFAYWILLQHLTPFPVRIVRASAHVAICSKIRIHVSNRPLGKCLATTPR